jgi:hypothetical protein
VPKREDDEGNYAVTSIRRFGALAVPLAVGLIAFGPGATAQAARSGITSPGSNAIITSGSTTTVTAHVDLLGTGTLYVRGPGTGGDRKIGSGVGPKDISGSVGIRRNGAYVATLKGLLGTLDQRTFYVRVPPARPSGVDASLSEHKLVVRWDRGHESDLTGYDVFAGGTRKRQGSPGALCAGDVCSTALSLPAVGGRVEVGVRARRSNGTGGTVTSGLSTTSVTLPVATAFSGPGGRAPARLPSATASANPLLPLPGRSPLSLPTVAPDGQAAGFQYPTPGPQVANPATAPKAEKASSAGPMRWGKSVALALILLIVAAHLGAWTRRLRLAQAAESSPDGAARSPARRNRRNQTERAPAPAPGSPVRPVEGPHPGGPSTGGARSGRLIDAKGTVANPALLNMHGDTRPAPAASADDADDAPSAGVVAATARAGAPAQGDGKTRSQHSKASGSRARRSAGYRGRRRAD